MTCVPHGAAHGPTTDGARRAPCDPRAVARSSLGVVVAARRRAPRAPSTPDSSQRLHPKGFGSSASASRLRLGFRIPLGSLKRHGRGFARGRRRFNDLCPAWGGARPDDGRGAPRPMRSTRARALLAGRGRRVAARFQTEPRARRHPPRAMPSLAFTGIVPRGTRCSHSRSLARRSCDSRIEAGPQG